MIAFNVIYINPMGIPGTLYGCVASSPQEALEKTPYMLAANSHWRPDQFRAMSACLCPETIALLKDKK